MSWLSVFCLRIVWRGSLARAFMDSFRCGLAFVVLGAGLTRRHYYHSVCRGVPDARRETKTGVADAFPVMENLD
jgi:hypothetical protein